MAGENDLNRIARVIVVKLFSILDESGVRYNQIMLPASSTQQKVAIVTPERDQTPHQRKNWFQTVVVCVDSLLREHLCLAPAITRIGSLDDACNVSFYCRAADLTSFEAATIHQISSTYKGQTRLHPSLDIHRSIAMVATLTKYIPPLLCEHVAVFVCGTGNCRCRDAVPGFSKVFHTMDNEELKLLKPYIVVEDIGNKVQVHILDSKPVKMKTFDQNMKDEMVKELCKKFQSLAKSYKFYCASHRPQGNTQELYKIDPVPNYPNLSLPSQNCYKGVSVNGTTSDQKCEEEVMYVRIK